MKLEEVRRRALATAYFSYGRKRYLVARQLGISTSNMRLNEVSKADITPEFAGIPYRELCRRECVKAMENHEGNLEKAAEEVGCSVQRLAGLLNGRVMASEYMQVGIDTTPFDGNEGLTLEEIEKRFIVAVFRAARFNATKTSKALGIGRATLYRKLKKYSKG